MPRVSESEKLARKGAKAVRRDRASRQRVAELMNKVKRGEMTAAQALRQRCEETKGRIGR